ncbi:MAG: ATP-binding cassette domain-containing protein, partial [Brucellaceae bacterium]|nr:ATP-binding cassette domain-containing protein [Brucellaceae bacterium]
MNAVTMPDAGAAVDAQAVSDKAPFFSVRDIHAYYGESYIVQGVSFEINEGDIVALLGRNGAGKTSTLRTLARARDPELKRGEIWLAGEAIHQMQDYQASMTGIQLVQ